MDLRAIPMALRLVFSRCTDSVTDSALKARKLARERNHASITPEHLLAGMVLSSRVFGKTFRKTSALTADPSQVLEWIGPTGEGSATQSPEFDGATRDLFSRARGLARESGCSYLGTQHLMLALLLGPDRPASDFLRNLGVEEGSLR